MLVSKIAQFAPVTNLTKFQNVRNVLTPMPYDSISFGSVSPWGYELMDAESGKIAADKLRKATSGYRAVYDSPQFDDKFLFSMTHTLAEHVQDQGQKTIMVAGDLRKATKEGAPMVKDIFLDRGMDVLVPQLEDTPYGEIAPVATPVLALATKFFNMPVSVLMTASHNPWTDGGYNFLTDEGAVATEKVTGPLADKLVEITDRGFVRPKVAPEKRGKEHVYDPYIIYADHIKNRNLIDFETIKDSGLQIFYEGLEGTGNYYYPKLMEENGIKLAKTFDTPVKGPNPEGENLRVLANAVKESSAPLKIGLATDGDPDRFGIIDENGERINNNDVIMLVAYHQIKNGGIKDGTIIRSNATSERIDKLANYFNSKPGYNIKVEQTPVGFKYIGDHMIELEEENKQTIVAGEESGGLTIGNHIPEKDGFVAISKIAELSAKEGKPISQILTELKEEADINFVSKTRTEKFLGEDGPEKMAKIVNYFQKMFDEGVDEIAGYKIDMEKTKNVDKHIRDYREIGDGIKFYFEDGTTLLVRKSGTEPAVKLYIDAKDQQALDDVDKYLDGILASV